ncbi:DNA repair protein, Swi5 [Penicillium griseofulvum]|uniref:DNA repair protein, Swi5 n=1 Tax=Penicillium patulum TaxID=5078 RepID=A0A135LU05_PENPA|nr:DNA repair protein, Swi5 [Penicillium griseofulvum]KXG52416.1 DNA repair protein, Swi5 [Penicillium griseofulvum]
MDQAKEEPKSYRDQQRLAALRASIANLEAKHAQLEKDLAALHDLLIDNPDATCNRYVKLLHEYNDIKDVGQGLMGILAEARGVRQVDVEKEFGVAEED